MELIEQLKDNPIYKKVLAKANELHLEVNINQKLIGFGKFEDFYLFYIFCDKNGNINFVARTEYSKKSKRIEALLVEENTNIILKAIENIYKVYLFTQNNKLDEEIVKEEIKEDIIGFVENPNTKIEPSEEYRRISIQLSEEIANVRTYFARLERLTPYYIFDNKVLERIVVNLPTTKELLMNVNGIGKVKAEKYGERIISTIKMIVKQYQIDEYQWRRYKRTREPEPIKPEPPKGPEQPSPQPISVVSLILRCLENSIDPFSGKKIEGLSRETILKLKSELGFAGEIIDDSNTDSKPNKEPKKEPKKPIIYRDPTKTIKVHDTVTVEDNKGEYTFTIFPVYYEYKPVSDPSKPGRIIYVMIPHCDANPELNQIAETAPLALAVLGKVEGEEYEFKVNEKRYTGIIKKVIKK